MHAIVFAGSRASSATQSGAVPSSPLVRITRRMRARSAPSRRFADLGHGIDEEGAGMQIPRGAALRFDILEDAFDLLGREIARARDFRGRHAVVEGVEA